MVLEFNHKIKGGILIDRFLTLKQFAEKQGISITAARELRRKGLPTIKPSGIIKVDMVKALVWMKQYEDAITYEAAAKLAGIGIGKLRGMLHKNRSVLIEGAVKSKISKNRFFDWMGQYEEAISYKKAAELAGMSIGKLKRILHKTNSFDVVLIKGNVLFKISKKRFLEWLEHYDEAITYKTAAELIRMRVGKLRWLARASKTFNAVLIQGNTRSKISKTRFLEWAKENIPQK
jgi:hypothetical protein